MSDNHGNTPAAWSAVAVALLGFVVGSVGLMLSPINYVVFWIGVALVVVAGVLFVVLSKLGYNGVGH
ncbi:HGxxPAAW family protein [Nocardioides sp.]|uniref:HGxxPAAW family protein n=1 Tax=Nocardioides sp. TaxID=35761 RepID=UPI0039E6E75A